MTFTEPLFANETLNIVCASLFTLVTLAILISLLRENR